MISTTAASATASASHVKVQRIWAELTGNCQLCCIHCYADSGPAVATGR